MKPHHRETHRNANIGWLRAAVLGANDGILSTASLVLGVAAANANHGNILITGIAGLVAGAMSMAAGEYVSVHSQADTENADIALEKRELAHHSASEHEELAKVYVQRGLTASLAKEVADQLMAHDALGAHMQDELGLSSLQIARPVQAAASSAASFAVGASIPLVMVMISPDRLLIPSVASISIVFLAILGALAAHVGGASKTQGAIRVTFWGIFAMGVTSIVGSIFGVAA